MKDFAKIKPNTRPVIGLYSSGLKAYWTQFPGLKERLLEYGNFICQQMSAWAEVKFFGLVDDEEKGKEAGQWFQSMQVDLIFCHCATYVTSACILPVHQKCLAPVVVLNLQPSAQINYHKTTTGEWLAFCGACVVPEIANTFNRAGIPFRCIHGLLGMDYTPQISLTEENTKDRPEAIRAWGQIQEWIKAAEVMATLRNSRFGFLGNTYSGMLDMYSDYTMFQAQLGMHVEVIEMCDLDQVLQTVTPKDIAAKLKEIEDLFQITEDSPSDPRVKKPTTEQLQWSAKVAVAQEKMIKQFNLDALAYYYHSAAKNPYEDLQSGFIVGHSLLTAKGIPCAGEGDLKTALAMKICDILNVGGSYCEIITTDYEEGTILIGHDGPFHVKIASEKPILRGLGIYHGKKGSGISVEAKVLQGDITTLNVTQTMDGRLKLIVSEAASTNGTIMNIGNTQTHVRFKTDPDHYMEQWFQEAPTHHCALAIGHNASIIQKVGDLMNLHTVTL